MMYSILAKVGEEIKGKIYVYFEDFSLRALTEAAKSLMTFSVVAKSIQASVTETPYLRSVTIVSPTLSFWLPSFRCDSIITPTISASPAAICSPTKN